MYCNSCQTIINKSDLVYCSQCGVPLHKDCANKCIKCGAYLCDSCSIENSFTCENCYQESDSNIKKIRRSHIEQYKRCPYSLYLQLFRNMIPPMGRHAELGVIVHDIIDKLKTHNQPLEESITILRNEVIAWNEEQDDEYSIITDDLIETGEICLTNYYNIKDQFEGSSESEENIIFKIRDDLPEVSCTLDRIVFKGDDIHIHDWKTGKPMSGKKLVTDLQPPLYIYGVYKKYGKYPKTFTLHYLKYNKDLVYNLITTEDDTIAYEVTTTRNTYVFTIDDMLQNVIKLLEGVKHNEFNMPSDNTHVWYCKNMCWFGLKNVCAGSQEEQWKALNKAYEKE